MNKADNNTILLAERFYTEDNMTCSEIAAKVGRNRRTIESWKKIFGWERKRAELIQSHSTMPQRIYKLWDKVTTQIEKDIDEGHEVSSSRCRLAIQLLERIPKAEQAEKAVSGLRQIDECLFSCLPDILNYCAHQPQCVICTGVPDFMDNLASGRRGDGRDLPRSEAW